MLESLRPFDGTPDSFETQLIEGFFKEKTRWDLIFL